MTARVSMLLKSPASPTFFRTCFLPGRAKDLSASRYREEGTTVPVQARRGPEGLQHVEAITFHANWCVSPTHRPSLSARKYPWCSCLLEGQYGRKDHDNKNFQRHHMEIETATFRLVAYVPQKIRHRVLPVYTQSCDILLCKLSPASK